MGTAIISRVFSKCHQAVLLDASFWNFLGILIGDALPTRLVLLGVGRCPPIPQISLGIKLSPLTIEAMNGLVPDDGADRAVIHWVIFAGIEIRWMQNACREIDGIGWRILVGIDRGRSHRPLVAVDRSSNLGDRTLEFKFGCI